MGREKAPKQWKTQCFRNICPEGAGASLGVSGGPRGPSGGDPWGLLVAAGPSPGSGMRLGGPSSPPGTAPLSARGPPESPKDPPAPSGHRLKIRCVFHCFGAFGGPGISRCRPWAHAGQSPWTPRSPLGCQGGSLTARNRKLGVGREACRGPGAAGGPGRDGAWSPGTRVPRSPVAHYIYTSVDLSIKWTEKEH